MNITNEITRLLKSTAYHEAGHIVAAVLQGMPLHDGGIHIDMEGSGVANYCHRRPGLLGNSDNDRDEREKTIVALYAGRIAQFTSLPRLDYRDYPDFWKSDWATAEQLLQELFPSEVMPPGTSFYARAQDLVTECWSIIENLSLALWKKPIRPMQRGEFEKGWSHGQKREEKHMSRSEVRAFFTTLGIPCHLWEEYRANRSD
jgi:hypothetical protein